jgi:hypothetical protein
MNAKVSWGTAQLKQSWIGSVVKMALQGTPVNEQLPRADNDAEHMKGST